MNVQLLWPAVRRPILNDTIMQRDGSSTSHGLGTNKWTADERGKLIDSYDAYFGDYTVDWKSHIVSHIVTGHLRPEKKATVFNRHFILAGDTLYLRSTDSRMAWQVKFVRVKKH